MATLPTPADILSWPRANYVDPITRRPLVLGVEIPLTVLTILFTAGRFYSRTIIVKALGWDDWFMLAATVRLLGVRKTEELTRHAPDSLDSNEYNDVYINESSLSDWVPSVRPPTRDPAQPLPSRSSTRLPSRTPVMWWFVNPLPLTRDLDGLGLSVALRSGLCLHQDITSDNVSSSVSHHFSLTLGADLPKGIFPGNTNKWFCYTLMVYEVAWGIASFFTSLFQCAPVDSYWLIQSPVRDCLDVGALYYSTSCLNIFTDCTYKSIISIRRSDT
jgi:hypothetical protein